MRKNLHWLSASAGVTCLALSGCGAMDDTAVGSSNQAVSGVFRLQSVHSGKCLDVAGGSTDPNANVLQWDCHDGHNQQWRAVQQPDGSHQLIAQHSGQCLDVYWGSTDDGANILQYWCTGNTNQRYWLSQHGDGTYEIKPVNSGKCVDIAGWGTHAGANVIQWSCHGGANQRFRLLPVGGGQPDKPPTLAAEFQSGNGWYSRAASGGSARFGVGYGGTSDGRVAELVFGGNSAYGSGDRVSPAFASEIHTAGQLHYGVYRARVQLARCAPHEDVVNGIFTYAHGGDSNGNGITDNHEIDIEILCGEPNWIWLSSWTDYDNDSSFRKLSRGINMQTGEYRQSPATNQYGMGPVLGVIPEARRPEFPQADTFYEMGWDWRPDSLRFFIVLDGREVTLWDLRDASLIPKGRAAMMFNVWHPATHWWAGGAADHPAADAVMRVDWFRHWSY